MMRALTIGAVVLALLSTAQAVSWAQQDVVTELPQSSKRWAIIIGIDQYDDQQIQPLIGAVNDAKAIAQALINYAGFPKSHVIVLTSNEKSAELQPKRAEIFGRLAGLKNLATGGLIVFAFSGHGIETNNEAYLLPSDAQWREGNVQLLQDTAISVSRLHDYLLETGAPQIIAILDACRNTPALSSRGVENELSLSRDLKLSFENDINRGVTAFATIYAAEKGQESFEDVSKKQGYFSEAFVQALQGANGATNSEGQVTLASLVRYLQQTVPERVRQDLNEEEKPDAEIGGFRADGLVLAGKLTAPSMAPNVVTITRSPGTIFRDPRDESNYVLIRGGNFLMGCVGIQDKNCYSDEKPRHSESVSSFRIGQTEVTVAAYRRFTESNTAGIALPPAPYFNPNWEEGSQPIVNVSWTEAQQYCRWAGGRLPTEAEWEYAARGGMDGLIYPWGNQPSHDRANYGKNQCCAGSSPDRSQDKWVYTAPVGKFRPNRFGLFDMAGNVWEWVEDPYRTYGNTPTVSLSVYDSRRVLKGGSWLSTPGQLRISARLPAAPDSVDTTFGFRCVLPVSRK